MEILFGGRCHINRDTKWPGCSQKRSHLPWTQSECRMLSSRVWSHELCRGRFLIQYVCTVLPADRKFVSSLLG